LFVDDDEAFGHALAKFLVDAGLQVTVAPDYREGRFWRAKRRSIFC
jgi:DNA-binding response OmpR family regulator